MATNLRSERAEPSDAIRPIDLGVGALFSLTRDAVVAFDLDSRRIALWNPAAEAIFGCPAAEAIGQTVERFLPGGLGALEDGSAAGPVALVGRRRDGADLVVETTLGPVDGATVPGRYALLIVRHDAEREAARARLEAVLQQMPSGVIIVEAPSGRLLLANQQVETILRGSVDDAIQAVDRGAVLAYHPDGRPVQPHEGALVRALAGEVVDSEEIEVVRLDGTRGVVHVNATPVRTGDRISAAVAVFYDVTDRRRAERLFAETARHASLRADVGAALDSRAPLGQLLQACTDAVVRHLDAAFARVWLLDEPEQLLELQASSGLYTRLDGAHGRVPVGQLEIGLIAAERQPHLTNEVVGDPRVGDQEWAGREGMVAFAGYPLLVEERLVGVLAMFARAPLSEAALEALGNVALMVAQGVERRRAEDERMRQAEELARSNAELEQFAYVASHDLQEPLRVVVSYLQLLERRYKGQLDERADKYIGYTVGASERMKRLINDLLTYSRVGRKERAFGDVDLERLLAEVGEDLGVAIEESGAVVSHGPLPTVRGEPRQLHQLLLNLVGNAVKFRRDDPPRVHVSAERDENGWRFDVRDNGIGIDPSFDERIFVIFQRLHGRTEYPGTGIGLALAKKIVERHGGRIWVEPAPDQGSIFSFTLPDGSNE